MSCWFATANKWPRSGCPSRAADNAGDRGYRIMRRELASIFVSYQTPVWDHTHLAARSALNRSLPSCPEAGSEYAQESAICQDLHGGVRRRSRPPAVPRFVVGNPRTHVRCPALESTALRRLTWTARVQFVGRLPLDLKTHFGIVGLH
jgi:hypothetical protein